MAIASATASFTGVEDSVAVSWSGITSSPPKVYASAPIVTDAPTDIPEIDLESVTSSGCTVITSARFTGTVNLLVLD